MSDYDTLVLHCACDEPIFVVRGGLRSGDAIEAHNWVPLNAEWPRPQAHTRTICPNCHVGFLAGDRDLLRVHVQPGVWGPTDA